MKYFLSKKVLSKIAKWGCSRFLTILNSFYFYKNCVNWPNSGSDNWMQNIISNIFGKKFQKNCKMAMLKAINYQRFEFLYRVRQENFYTFISMDNNKNVKILLAHPVEVDRPF